MAINFGLSESGGGYLDTLQAFALGRESKLQQHKQQGREKASQQLGAGDIGGARTTAIQTGNNDMATSIGAMHDDDRKVLAEQSEVIGSTAYGLRQLPKEQRSQALLAAVPALRARGLSPDEIRAAAADLSDGALDGYINAATTVKDHIAAMPKPTDAQQNLQAAGVQPGTPEFKEAMLGHVNPSQFMEFGSDATGRQLIQTRGMTGGGGQSSGAPGAPAPGGGSITQRYNNPGAIRPDGQSQWQGMTGVSPEGFVTFDTPENGRRAGIINVQNQAKLHGIQTLGDLFQKYAPSSDGNDPVAYAARVGQSIGVRPDQPINLADPQVAAAVFDAGIVPVERGGSPSPQQAQQQPQNGPRVVASTPPIAKERDAPSGYRWSGDGRLEAIPGGPGDTKHNATTRTNQVNLRKEFNNDKLVDTFTTQLRPAFQTIDAIVKKGGGNPQDDTTLVYNFMKLASSDGSAVREGEYALAGRAAGMSERLVRYLGQADTGNSLTAQMRKEIRDAAATLYTSRRNSYNQKVDQYRGYANEQGLDPDQVARKYISPADRARSRRGAGAVPADIAAILQKYGH